MTDKLMAWVSKTLDAEEGIMNNMNICEKIACFCFEFCVTAINKSDRSYHVSYSNISRDKKARNLFKRFSKMIPSVRNENAQQI